MMIKCRKKRHLCHIWPTMPRSDCGCAVWSGLVVRSLATGEYIDDQRRPWPVLRTCLFAYGTRAHFVCFAAYLFTFFYCLYVYKTAINVSVYTCMLTSDVTVFLFLQFKPNDCACNCILARECAQMLHTCSCSVICANSSHFILLFIAFCILNHTYTKQKKIYVCFFFLL